MSEPTKFCKDCKWVSLPRFDPYGDGSLPVPTCIRPTPSKTYLVDGVPTTPLYSPCVTERGIGMQCGTEGSLWEPRK